jgi:hypothetical protein
MTFDPEEIVTLSGQGKMRLQTAVERVMARSLSKSALGLRLDCPVPTRRLMALSRRVGSRSTASRMKAAMPRLPTKASSRKVRHEQVGAGLRSRANTGHQSQHRSPNTMKLTVKTLTPKQGEKMQIANAWNDGFLAACKAMRQVFSAPEHKGIRKIINAVNHTQGDPSLMRMLRNELRAKKARKA